MHASGARLVFTMCVQQFLSYPSLLLQAWACSFQDLSGAFSLGILFLWTSLLARSLFGSFGLIDD